MKRGWIIFGVLGGILAIIGLSMASSYNGLVMKREDVRAAFSNVETKYQRRADLVPSLVNTVKGASDFEQETLTEVTEARARATSITIDASTATPEQIAAYQSAQGELSQALGKLLAIAENYPQLQAVAAYQDLQSQLEGTENRIAVARKDYNNVAKEYNARIMSFPTNILANTFGFDEVNYFEADEGTSTAPIVDFGE